MPKFSADMVTDTHIGKNVPDHIAFPALLRRLLANSKRTESGCLEWTGWRNAVGYGMTCFRGRSRPTHRLMHMVAKGPIPDGLQVLHSCDNPPCMEPDHISPGTGEENMNQAVERGRHAKVQNTHCPQGHLYAIEGTVGRTTGWRTCKTCIRIKYRLKAGWPLALALSEPPRGGSSPIHGSKWREAKVRKGRKVQTHCKHGHLLSGDNLYLRPDGHRQCKACHHEAVKRFKPKAR
jgi:HNH endonuclease